MLLIRVNGSYVSAANCIQDTTTHTKDERHESSRYCTKCFVKFIILFEIDFLCTVVSQFFVCLNLGKLIDIFWKF